MNLDTRVQALAFAALLGVAPDDTDMTGVVVPDGHDGAAYLSMLRDQLTNVAQHRANGNDTAARTAASELLNGYELALRLAPPNPAGDFASWFAAQVQAEGETQ